VPAPVNFASVAIPPAIPDFFSASLNLMTTQVSDVSPLAGLSRLKSLDLEDTQVSDASPLAGLSGLQRLDLTGTKVEDVSVLADIRGLMIRGFSDRRRSRS
jgi:Leucine-rich repeat (LRR) protein